MYAIGFLAAGLVALALGWAMDRWSSFEGLSFPLEMVLIIAGIVGIAAGIATGGAHLFTVSSRLFVPFLIAVAVMGGGVWVINSATSPPASYIGMGMIILGFAATAGILIFAQMT